MHTADIHRLGMNEEPSTDKVWKAWSILLMTAVLLFIWLSSCSMTPARAEEIDLQIIAQIESSNNSFAYNPKSKARGICQITPICLKDYVKKNDILLCDPDYLFNPAFNFQVAEWYMNKRIPQLLNHYKFADTLENRLWAYNAGIGNLVKGKFPLETKNYIKKYKQLARAK